MNIDFATLECNEASSKSLDPVQVVHEDMWNRQPYNHNSEDRLKVVAEVVSPSYLPCSNMKEEFKNDDADATEQNACLPSDVPTTFSNEAAVLESGMYVNPKQYYRILKRREARAKLIAQGKICTERQKYLYESRHRHAVLRRRARSGMFSKND